MRHLAACLLVTALVATGCGDEPDKADVETTQCRTQWVDLAQLHSENGNPRGPVPALAVRWDELADEAARLAHTATSGDCGANIADFTRAWAALEDFQYALADFDPAADLAIAELDLEHRQGLEGLPPGTEIPPGDLKDAFDVIRRETPPAIADLEPALEGAADLDLEDETALQAFLQKAGRIKGASVHIRRMAHPYRVIGDAELDEE